MLVGCGGEVWGGGSAKKKSCYIYIIPRTALAMLTPTRSPLAVSKSCFFTSHVFLGVRLFAYRFRHLSDGFRPYNIVDGTLTSGLRYCQHLTELQDYGTVNI